MAQAASAHQSLLRHQPQRCPRPNLERHRGLPAGRHFEKTSAGAGQSLHYLTDIEPHALRKIAHFTSPLSISPTRSVSPTLPSSMFTGFLNRTVVVQIGFFWVLNGLIGFVFFATSPA